MLRTGEANAYRLACIHPTQRRMNFDTATTRKNLHHVEVLLSEVKVFNPLDLVQLMFTQHVFAIVIHARTLTFLLKEVSVLDKVFVTMKEHIVSVVLVTGS